MQSGQYASKYSPVSQTQPFLANIGLFAGNFFAGEDSLPDM